MTPVHIVFQREFSADPTIHSYAVIRYDSGEPLVDDGAPVRILIPQGEEFMETARGAVEPVLNAMGCTIGDIVVRGAMMHPEG